MKRLFISAIAILLLPIIAFAQNKSITEFPEIKLGTDKNGEPVMFNFIPLEDDFKEARFYSSDPYVIAKCIDYIIVYDTQQNTMKSKIRKHYTDSIFAINNDGILLGGSSSNLFANYSRPIFYDFDGNVVWKKNIHPFLKFTDVNVVISKKGKDNFSALDLSTGKQLWKRKIPRICMDGMRGMHKSAIDSNYIYFVTDSLLRLDLRTGHTISRPFRSRIADFSFGSSGNDKFTNLDYICEALASKYLPITLLKSTYSGMHSNWLEKNDSLIIADADSIYCLDPYLKTIWSQALPENAHSLTSLRLLDGKIYLTSYGVAFINGNIRNTKKPYVATLDASDGHILSATFPKIDKKIINAYNADGKSYWQTSEALYYCNEGDSIAHKIEYKPDTPYEKNIWLPDYFIQDKVYTAENGFLKSIYTDSTQLVVMKYDGDINVIKPDGQCIRIPDDETAIHDNSNIYVTYCDSKDKTTYYIVEPETKKIIYTFKINGNLYISGDLILIGLQNGIGVHKMNKR